MWKGNAGNRASKIFMNDPRPDLPYVPFASDCLVRNEPKPWVQYGIGAPGQVGSFGMSLTELAKKLEMSPPSVGFSMERGDAVADEKWLT